MISSAAKHPDYRDHVGRLQYGIESYIAVPLLRRDGRAFGTLCALDPEPAQLSDDHVETFELLAGLIAHELEQQEVARERETFVGVLGHDLRTPLNALALNTEILEAKVAADPDGHQAVLRMRRAIDRMGRMVADLMDFTRGRLGLGFELERKTFDLAAGVRELAAELQPQTELNSNRIVIRQEAAMPFVGDRPRLLQALSNLLANAVAHAAPGSDVEVVLTGDGEGVAIEIRNQGEPIPTDVRERVFEPFVRGVERAEARSGGLGLGLFIASQAVRAHGGEITVCSGPEPKTVFRVELPRPTESAPA